MAGDVTKTCGTCKNGEQTNESVPLNRLRNVTAFKCIFAVDQMSVADIASRPLMDGISVRECVGWEPKFVEQKTSEPKTEEVADVPDTEKA